MSGSPRKIFTEPLPPHPDSMQQLHRKIGAKNHNLTVIVIDVLRASTTICAALQAGARAIYPVPSVADAFRLAERFKLDGRDALICGERDGHKVEGFDLGNSPFEYTQERVGNRSLIFASTNGSVLMSRVSTLSPRQSLIAGVVNLSATVAAIESGDGPILIMCSGKEGRLSLEDLFAAGALVERLQGVSGAVILEDDSSRLALDIFHVRRNDKYGLPDCAEHLRYLISLGFERDVSLAGAVDAIPVLPILQDGIIRLSPNNEASGTGH